MPRSVTSRCQSSGVRRDRGVSPVQRASRGARASPGPYGQLWLAGGRARRASPGKARSVEVHQHNAVRVLRLSGADQAPHRRGCRVGAVDAPSTATAPEVSTTRVAGSSSGWADQLCRASRARAVRRTHSPWTGLGDPSAHGGRASGAGLRPVGQRLCHRPGPLSRSGQDQGLRNAGSRRISATRFRRVGELGQRQRGSRSEQPGSVDSVQLLLGCGPGRRQLSGGQWPERQRSDRQDGCTRQVHRPQRHPTRTIRRDRDTQSGRTEACSTTLTEREQQQHTTIHLPDPRQHPTMQRRIKQRRMHTKPAYIHPLRQRNLSEHLPTPTPRSPQPPEQRPVLNPPPATHKTPPHPPAPHPPAATAPTRTPKPPPHPKPHHAHAAPTPPHPQNHAHSPHADHPSPSPSTTTCNRNPPRSGTTTGASTTNSSTTPAPTSSPTRTTTSTNATPGTTTAPPTRCSPSHPPATTPNRPEATTPPDPGNAITHQQTDDHPQQDQQQPHPATPSDTNQNRSR